MAEKIKIGTRSSPLALAQAEEVKALLLAAHDDLNDDDVVLVPMSTKGDRVLDKALALIGGKGLFTEEIEAALMAGEIDLAVHSTKDMPTVLPDGLVLSTFLKREDPRDAFLSNKASCIADLPEGAVVGTASLRRQAQVKRLRPDLKVVVFRGNVQSRMKKLKDGEVDATFLAQAGLNRLGLGDVATDIVSVDDLLPAPAQGAISIEIKADNDKIANRLKPLNHKKTQLAVTAERSFLRVLDGSCRTPIAALATIEGNTLTLVGRVLSANGCECYETEVAGPSESAEGLGQIAGEAIRGEAGEEFFEALLKATE